MTDVKTELTAELVGAGLDQREARWLIEEFVPGNDRDAIAALRVAARRRLDGEPLQYIIGHWPFCSLDLEVDKRVLIPRPETEELVHVALTALAKGDVVAPVIMDMGCGSGAIGLALLDELRRRGVVASLVAIDESLDALALAKRNARKHQLNAVSFVHSSWFDNVDASLAGNVDLIVANPPYVSEEEFLGLDPVLRFEPIGALVAPDARGVGGFADLDIIIEEAYKWLKPGGLLICEHANTHRDAVVNASNAAGFHGVEDVKDLAGHPRILVARR
ncbi:MAG TPA: peptide chain release factor N(5)-glutamine methyltransferase [Acidimicrobiales bacterium]